MENLYRRNPSGSTRRDFLKGTGAVGLTLAATGRARGQSVVVINANGSISTNAVTGAAKWISPSAFVASSLEGGRIGYIVAWGGNEYGYAYTYALSGAPAGVTIDVDLGILSMGSRLSPGTYSFSVRVTNRKVVSNVATFPITLTIVQGVTASRTGNQILHKTYDPHSGTYGSPSGSDWTAVFNRINTTILADQISAGDGNLRAQIPLRGGVQYNYTNNRWSCGAQFLTVYQDSRYPGARPRLCCTQTSYSFDTEVAILQAGGGSFLDYVVAGPNAKMWQTLINATAVGDRIVTMKNAANASTCASAAGIWSCPTTSRPRAVRRTAATTTTSK
jgi:hypothetical protein